MTDDRRPSWLRGSLSGDSSPRREPSHHRASSRHRKEPPAAPGASPTPAASSAPETLSPSSPFSRRDGRHAARGAAARPWLMSASSGPGAHARADELDPPRGVTALFVCTGNICRSAAAEALARDLAPECGPFASAGTGAVIDADIDPPMARRLATMVTTPPARHAARQIDSRIVQTADLIFGMDPQHLLDINAVEPTAAERSFLLLDAADILCRTPPLMRRPAPALAAYLRDHRTGLGLSGGASIPDPYRQTRELYDAALASVTGAVETIVGWLSSTYS